MRTLALAAVAALAAGTSAVPASADCVTDYADGLATIALAPLVVGTVRSNPDGSYTVQPYTPVNFAIAQAGDANDLVDCIV